MQKTKNLILEKLCYTELVYGRINKKLGMNLSKSEIEAFILKALQEAPLSDYIKKGKNYYITNEDLQVRVTVNSYTFRVITADKTRDLIR